MPKEAPAFPQVTEDQFELWEAHPVTKALVQCFEWRRLDSIDAGGTGKLVDSSSADLTHALLHRELGRQDAYADARNIEALLEHYGMIFHPPEEPNDD